MAKYDQLVTKYADEITEIKTRQQEHTALIDQINALGLPILHPEPDYTAIAQLDDLCAQAEQINSDLLVACDMLDQDIQAEYHNVPFAGPRQAGIDGFYREAGLERGD